MSNQLIPTPGQTVGPFFHYGMPYHRGEEVSAPFDPRSILLSGHIFDGNDVPVPDAQIEIWQADEDGRIPQVRGTLKRDGHTFTGFGRAATNDDGYFEFWTRNPGILQNSRSNNPAPFISVIVYARGLLDKIHTRIYLPEHHEAMATDPLMEQLIAEQRATLIAKRTAEGNLKHDIYLQGAKETVFLEFNQS